MTQKLSPKFPGTTNPVHIGVYKVFYKFYDDELEIAYSYWDGNQWNYCANSPDEAVVDYWVEQKSVDLYGYPFKWQGITK